MSSTDEQENSGKYEWAAPKVAKDLFKGIPIEKTANYLGMTVDYVREIDEFLGINREQLMKIYEEYAPKKYRIICQKTGKVFETNDPTQTTIS